MKRPEQRIYRLDGFEIDTSLGCIKRDGEECHMRQKSFQVLLYLLEQRPRLVTKTELIDQLWQAVAVTDNVLDQCLTEIRRVLGDDPRNPRFVKTVPRAGYRFIGTVEEGTVESSREFEPKGVLEREVVAPPEVSRTLQANPATDLPAAEAIRSSWSRHPIVWLLLLTVLLSAAGTIVYVQNRLSAAKRLPGMTLPEVDNKKRVAVMFFDNQSSSAELDWLREGLADMLITGLSNSKQLTVLSREQLTLMLERSGHKELENIRLETALDLARRSQAQIFVLGGFGRLGEQIRIDIRLHDASNGQLLTAERLVVEKPAEILTQIDLLSLKLSQYLGAEVRKEEAEAELTRVMTNNLEAYRYYSLAVEKAQGLHNSEAIALLEKAVALDPQFAMAYARIGYAYAVTGADTENAKPYLERAFRLAERLTEKDRLHITAWYAIANKDYRAAIGSFREMVGRYPLEVEGYLRLARLLRGEELFDEALEVAKQGLVIDPGAKDLYNFIGSAYSELGRHEEAIAMFKRYVELSPDEPNAHDSLGLGYQWSGRYNEAVREYQQALRLNPAFEIALIHLGNTYFQQGRYTEAIGKFQEYIRLSKSNLERARGYNSIALVRWRQSNLSEAEKNARLARRIDERVISGSILAALELGQLTVAEKLITANEAKELIDRGARGHPRERYYLRGRFADAKGNSSEAVEAFREALRYRPPIWNVESYEDCLANAYLSHGRLDEALAEYQRVLRLNPNYPLVHYRLAQVYERMGQPDQARREYHRFLEIWKDADADIPEMIAAKKAAW